MVVNAGGATPNEVGLPACVYSQEKEINMFNYRSRIGKAGLTGLLTASFLVAPLGAALAANLSGGGQPGVECEDAGAAPGNSERAQGSAFNPEGVAGTVYAGEQEQNSQNSHSVSQYDIACFKVAAH